MGSGNAGYILDGNQFTRLSCTPIGGGQLECVVPRPGIVAIVTTSNPQSSAPNSSPAQPSPHQPDMVTPPPAGQLGWVRGYPSRGNPQFNMTAGCVYYVAQWSDGTYTSTPWDCNPGVVARDGNRTASRGYPQIARNGCTEYVTEWADNRGNKSWTWVPFSCPSGVWYPKPRV